MDKGIYKITFIGTDYYYWGRSSFYDKRVKKHLRTLRKGTHDNPMMQAIFNKYGEDSFQCKLVVVCEGSYCEYLEQTLIDRDYGKPECMNLNPKANSGPGARIANSGSFKQGSQVNVGRHHTEDTKMKISKAKQGKNPWNKGLKGGTWSPARREAQLNRKVNS